MTHWLLPHTTRWAKITLNVILDIILCGWISQDANTGSSNVTCVLYILEGSVVRPFLLKEGNHISLSLLHTKTHPQHAVRWTRCHVSLYVAVEKKNGVNINVILHKWILWKVWWTKSYLWLHFINRTVFNWYCLISIYCNWSVYLL